MRAIIVPPGPNCDHMGEGVYTLVAEDGEGLCSHFCSSYHFAPGDLFQNRPERGPMFDAKGITEYCWLSESGISRDELLRRNVDFDKNAKVTEALTHKMPTGEVLS